MSRGRLLIIDIDCETRGTLQFAFVRRGWEVITTTTEQEGLAVLSDYNPDWIIVSAGHVNASGSFISEVRNNARGARLSIVGT